MLPLSPIADSAESVFLTCIGRIKDDALRNRLTGIKNHIIQHDTDFVAAGQAATYYMLRSHDSVGGTVTKDELISVYDHQFVPATSDGRVFYNKIMALAKHRRCPLCAYGTVTTLDHYLPKTHFPGLAVCPKNLLPACSDCNKRKRAALPHCASQQTLNPYYDDIDGVVWLQAKFKKRTPVLVEFYVQQPKAWNKITAMRVRYHFTAFNLAQVFSSQATIELEDVKEYLTNLLNRGGETEVQRHLLGEANSRSAACKNSWRAALYRALAASSWFCHTGCKG
jgi:hypothetical protein